MSTRASVSGLPVVVHNRDSNDEMLGVVREEAFRDLQADFHSFAGGRAMAEEETGLIKAAHGKAKQVPQGTKLGFGLGEELVHGRIALGRAGREDCGCRAKFFNQSIQGIAHSNPVLAEDLRPHLRRSARDTSRIAEAGATKIKSRRAFLADRINENGSQEMRQMADRRDDGVMLLRMNDSNLSADRLPEGRFRRPLVSRAGFPGRLTPCPACESPVHNSAPGTCTGT